MVWCVIEQIQRIELFSLFEIRLSQVRDIFSQLDNLADHVKPCKTPNHHMERRIPTRRHTLPRKFYVSNLRLQYRFYLK